MKPEERFAAGAILLVIIVFIVSFTKLVITLAVLVALIYGLGFAAEKILDQIEEN